MDFNLLSEGDLQEIVYSNIKTLTYTETKDELANLAVQGYVQAIQNNYQNYVLTTPLIALDRSVRFPQQSTNRYTKEQILNLDENHLNIFMQIYQVAPSQDVRRTIYKILKLQGFIARENKIKTQDLINFVRKDYSKYDVYDTNILDISKLGHFNHFTNTSDLDVNLEKKVYVLGRGIKPGGFYFAPDYKWVVYSACELGRKYKYQYKIDTQDPEARTMRIAVIDNLKYLEQLMRGTEVDFTRILHYYDGIFIPNTFRKLSWYFPRGEYDKYYIFLGSLDVESIIIWNTQKLKLKKVDFNYDEFVKNNPTIQECLTY